MIEIIETFEGPTVHDAIGRHFMPTDDRAASLYGWAYGESVIRLTSGAMTLGSTMWNMHVASNGYFFIEPDHDILIDVHNPAAFWTATVNSRTLGAICSLYAANTLAWREEDGLRDLAKRASQLYYLGRDFVYEDGNEYYDADQISAIYCALD